MRISSGFLSGVAVLAGMAGAPSSPAQAANSAWASGQDPQDRASALRAEWLARGHTVQELAATAPPRLTGGNVTASTITAGKAGEFPSLRVAFATDTPGLSSILLTFASPNGETFYGGGYGTFGYEQSGDVSFAIVTPISLYAAPGQWTLVNATVFDNAGNSTSYGSFQLAALFKNLSFTVVNPGPVASAPPRILAGHLLNTTVSLSTTLPELLATLQVKDGQGPGVYQDYVIIQPPGATYQFYSFLPNPKPVRGGTLQANSIFGPNSPTGTWTITGYGSCDFANNCSGSMRDADVVALFGTDSFTVTP